MTITAVPYKLEGGERFFHVEVPNRLEELTHGLFAGNQTTAESLDLEEAGWELGNILQANMDKAVFKDEDGDLELA